MGEKILVPIEGRNFYKDGRLGLSNALDECLSSGYTPLFMPQIVDGRIMASKGDRIWMDCYITPSIRATGRGKSTNVSHKGGAEFVVYAHVPNYFSKPRNIRKASKKELAGGAGIMPQKEFQRLLDMKDDENIFVIGYKELKGSKSGTIYVSEALEHPQTIPFLGGEERAEAYLKKYKQICGRNRIEIQHCDDLAGEPLGRMLFLGNIFSYNYSLRGSHHFFLYDYGCFLGIPNRIKI